MVGLILSPIEENKFLTGHEFERASFTVGDMALVSMARTLRFSPSDSLARMLELNNIQTQHLRQPSGERAKKLSPEEATKKYGIPGQLSFDHDVLEGVAALLNKRKGEEIFQDLILSKAEGSQRLGLLGLDLIASLLDPINVGSAFIPIVGPARFASMLSRYGTTRARAVRGLIDGSVGNAMVEPLVFSAARQEQANYTEIDTLMNVTFGGLLGTGLHVTFGRIGDSIRGVSQRAHQQAVKTSVNQMAQGGQVQVEPVLGSDNLSTVENVNVVDLDGDTTVLVGDRLDSELTTTVADLKAELARRHKTISEIEEMQNSGFSDDEIITQIVGVHGKGTTVQGLIDFANERIKFTTDLLKKAVETPPVSEKLGKPGDIGPILSDGVDEYSDLYHSATRLEEAINTENLEGTGEINLGSQIGEVMVDQANGKKYYVKTPESPVHAKNEFATALFYKSLGANIPDVRLVMENRRVTGVASEFVDDLTGFDVETDLIKYAQDFPNQHKRFMTTIMFDAWLGNRDAYSPGNLFLDANNELIRLDFGGGLLFQATGPEKVDFKAEVIELKTFKEFVFSKQIWESLPADELEVALVKGVEALAGMDAIKIGKIVAGVGLPPKQFKQIVSVLTERHADILFKFKDKVDLSNASVNFTQFFDSYNAIKHTQEALNFAKKKFTFTEKEAISTYQGGDTNNHTLRTKGYDGLGKTSKKQVDNLDKAIRKLTLLAPVTTFRGGVPKTSLVTPQTPAGITDLASAQSLIGHVISDPGYLSTSTSFTIAKNRTGQQGTKVLLRMYLPSGHHAAVPNEPTINSKSFVSEAELILQRELPLQIVAAEELKGTNIIAITVRPVSKSIQPVTPKAQVKMAKSYKDLASSAADDNVMEEEFAVALSEAFKTPDDQSLLNTVQSVTDDLEIEVKGLPDIEAADIDVINTAFNDVVKKVDAIKKGALKAFKCVLGKA